VDEGESGECLVENGEGGEEARGGWRGCAGGAREGDEVQTGWKSGMNGWELVVFTKKVEKNDVGLRARISAY